MTELIIYFVLGTLTGYAIRTVKAVFEDKKMLEVLDANDERTMKKMRSLKMEISTLKTERAYLWNQLQEARRKEHAREFDCQIQSTKEKSPVLKFGE